MELVITELSLGLLCIFLLVFRNSYKDKLFLVSALILGVFVIKILLYIIPTATGLSLWAINSILLMLFYLIRFRNRAEKRTIDYVKLSSLPILFVYPLTPHFTYPAIQIGAWLALPVLGIIYIYDRWILKPENMKRKYVIVLVIQSVVILLVMVYAFTQKLEAERQTIVAYEQRKIAEEQSIRATELENDCQGRNQE